MTHPILRGRAKELSAATRVVRRALRTGQGGLIVLTGEAGIGKSALLNAIGAAALSSGFVMGSSKADAINQLSPGAALLLALRSGPVPLVDSDGFAELTRLVQQPLLLADEISSHLEKIATGSPLMIALDDVHWADRLSVFCLRILTSRLAGTPVIWVLASRDRAEILLDELAVPGVQGPLETVLRLGPLTTADISAIAHDRLGRVPSAPVRAMLEKASGNAFLAVQVTDGLARDRANGQDEDALPESFVLGVRRRLGRLQPSESDLVRIAAVLGRPLTLGEAVELLGNPSPAQVLDLIDHVVQAGLLAHLGPTIGFRHDLIRETVYADLTDRMRQSLHRRCADVLMAAGHPALDAAAHIRAAMGPDDEEAVTILRQAAEEATTALPTVAGDLILDAFGRLAETHPLWSEVGGQCVQILSRVQRGADAVVVADRLLDRLQEPDEIAQVQVLVTHTLWTMGRLGTILPRIDETLHREGVSEIQRARLGALRVLTMTRLAPAEVARSEAEAALERARGLGDEDATVLALQACGEVAKNSGYHAQALARFREMRIRAGATYLSEEITCLQMLDRYTDAEVMLEAAWSDDRNGVEGVLPSLLYAQMWQDFNFARLEEAESGAQTLVRLSRELGNDRHRLEASMVLTAIAMMRGDLDRARELLAPVTGDQAMDVELVPSLVLMQGWLTASAGRWDEAIDLLAPGLYGARDSRMSWPWWSGWTRMFVLVGVAAGDPAFVEAAVGLAEEGAVRNPGVVSFQGVALQLRALVTQDLDLMERAARILEGSPRPLIRAGSTEDYGRLLIEHGRKSEGMEQLDRAWDILYGIGSQGSVKLLQELMLAMGVHQAKWRTGDTRPRTGWDALSPSEVNVSRLIAAGHTNRSAAGRLGLSPNTVGTHLRSVFAKLDIQSRVQLTNIVHERSRIET